MASRIACGCVRTTTTTTATATPANRLTETCALGLLDIHQRGHLTPVKTKYPLTSITRPFRGLTLRAHRGHMFFENDR